MKNQIIQLGEKNRKVFGFTDEQIIISSKEHKSFESLIASTKKSGILESIKVIPIKSLTGLGYNEKDNAFTINYKHKDKTKKTSILLEDVEMRDSIVSKIAELKEFKKDVVDESKTKPLIINLIVVVAIPIFTWIFRNLAINSENGEHYVATGRRSGIKQLVANAIEAIGSTGITIIGVLGLAYMIYITYKRFTNPASEISFN